MSSGVINSNIDNRAGIADNKYFAKQHKGLKQLGFWVKIYQGYTKAYYLLARTLLLKECYYGPFKGEFGHFLAHNLPFLMYLHSKGVKIHYCGMELHKPFLVDENKKSIVHEWFPLRDFFAEVAPNCNNTIPPKDVQIEIDKFQKIARDSGKPYWNIDDEFFYWYIMRNWLLKGPFTKAYDLEKAYRTKEELSVTVFPRNKGAQSTPNNGEAWDYQELIEKISPYFDKVYVTGHPSQTIAIVPKNNIELCISSDNMVILEKCANSKLIITQHSGVNNMGEYTNNKVLIIYKGPLPIGSMNNTLRFRPSIGTKHELSFAYSMEDVVIFVKEFTKRNGYKKEN